MLVTITWVFFRNHKAPVGRSFMILQKMAGFSFSEPLQTPLNHVEMWFCVFLVVFLLIKEHYYLKIPTWNTTVFFILFAVIIF